MELLNIQRYFPDEMPFGSNVVYFQSEKGEDFYQSFSAFTKKYKLCINPDTGVVLSVSEDISELYPAGCSVVEVDELPADFDIKGSWRYSEGVVAKVPDDYAKKAESQRQSLLTSANDTIADWRTKLLLESITDEDKAALIKWMAYIDKLKAMDFAGVTDDASYQAIDWPPVPET